MALTRRSGCPQIFSFDWEGGENCTFRPGKSTKRPFSKSAFSFLVLFISFYLSKPHLLTRPCTPAKYPFSSNFPIVCIDADFAIGFRSVGFLITLMMKFGSSPRSFLFTIRICILLSKIARETAEKTLFPRQPAEQRWVREP